MRVITGEVIAYRLFDLAYAIDLGRAEALWQARAGARSVRQRLRATPPKAVAYDVPPLSLTLAPERLALPDAAVTATVTARLYDFGVLALAVHVPAGDLDWDAFVDRVEAVNALLGPGTETTFWSLLTDAIKADLGAGADPARAIAARGGLPRGRGDDVRPGDEQRGAVERG